jgi:hypothetical protein
MISSVIHRVDAMRRLRQEQHGYHRTDRLDEEGARRRDRFWIIIADDRLHRADDLAWITSDGGAVLIEEFVPL